MPDLKIMICLVRFIQTEETVEKTLRVERVSIFGHLSRSHIKKKQTKTRWRVEMALDVRGHLSRR